VTPAAGPPVRIVAAIWAAVCLGWGCTGDAAPFAVQPVTSPAPPGSGEPDLLAGEDGNLYLTWMEPAGEGHALRFARRDSTAWTEARTIASGKDLLANWADFPRLCALADGTLGASWLVTSPRDAHAYDVRMAISQNAGVSWTPPATTPGDTTSGEHGFVSMIPYHAGFVFVWLGPGRSAGGGTMLHSGYLTKDGWTEEGDPIDGLVCDCCGTDAARNGRNEIVVIYRDRSREEVRDISVARLDRSGWSEPSPVHADGWTIAGCPVNGPALAGAGDVMAAVWFTMSGEQGEVRAAITRDGARTFGEPVRVDGGSPLGRIDVTALPAGGFLVSWIEKTGDGAGIRVRTLAETGVLGAPQTIATTSGDRAVGFPKLARLGEDIYLAWTGAEGVQVVRMRPR